LLQKLYKPGTVEELAIIAIKQKVLLIKLTLCYSKNEILPLE
jgi:hypothetical protein